MIDRIRLHTDGCIFHWHFRYMLYAINLSANTVPLQFRGRVMAMITISAPPLNLLRTASAVHMVDGRSSYAYTASLRNRAPRRGHLLALLTQTEPC